MEQWIIFSLWGTNINVDLRGNGATISHPNHSVEIWWRTSLNYRFESFDMLRYASAFYQIVLLLQCDGNLFITIIILTSVVAGINVLAALNPSVFHREKKRLIDRKKRHQYNVSTTTTTSAVNKYSINVVMLKYLMLKLNA